MSTKDALEAISKRYHAVMVWLICLVKTLEFYFQEPKKSEATSEATSEETEECEKTDEETVISKPTPSQSSEVFRFYVLISIAHFISDGFGRGFCGYYEKNGKNGDNFLSLA